MFAIYDFVPPLHYYGEGGRIRAGFDIFVLAEFGGFPLKN